MHIISGEFRVKPEFRDELICLSTGLLGPSQSEPGCVSYGFYEDKTDPCRFLFFERWQNRESITRHFETPYFRTFARRFPDMIEGQASISIYQVNTVEEL